MSLTQTLFSGIHTFMGVPYQRTCAEGTDVAIAGVPFDIGTTCRPGQRFGPNAIRDASLMSFYSDNPRFRQNPLSNLNIVDIEDFDIVLGDIVESLKRIEKQALACPAEQLICLGGDHTISLALLRAIRKKQGPVALVHFDAHVDTWPEECGVKITHGTQFYLAVKEGLINPQKSIQIGIRSDVDNDVMDWTIEQGFTILTSEMVHMSNPAAIADRIKQCVGDRPAYLSFDVDALDPSQAPGVGTPEIGGLWSWQVMSILENISDLNWKGMDCVEVLPAHDMSQITALAGAAVVWMYLGFLSKKVKR